MRLVSRTMLSPRLILLFALLPSLMAPSCVRAQPKPQPHSVAMSDGVELATDVYLPESGKGPFPTILIRTPYNKAGNRGTAGAVSKLGYALVVQDMRGRFESKGHHALIFGNDGLGGKHQDGHGSGLAEARGGGGELRDYAGGLRE